MNAAAEARAASKFEDSDDDWDALDEDWEGEVLMYYGLKNFYQNHRQYVDSRNEDQLKGDKIDYNDEEQFKEASCEPLQWLVVPVSAFNKLDS